MPGSRNSSRASDTASVKSGASHASARSNNSVAKVRSVYAPQNLPKRSASRGSSRGEHHRGQKASSKKTGDMPAGYSWAAGAEREILSTVQNLNDTEIQELSKELSSMRSEKLRSLEKAQKEKDALADELKATMESLIQAKAQSKRVLSDARKDKRYVANALRRHKEIFDEVKSLRLQSFSTGVVDNGILESAVDDLKSQLKQVKELQMIVNNLGEVSTDTDRIRQVLHFHKLDLALLQADNREAVMKAESQKDTYFQALLDIEEQLKTTKSAKQLEEGKAMAERSVLVKEHKMLSEELAKMEMQLLEKEVEALKALMAEKQGELADTKNAEGKDLSTASKLYDFEQRQKKKSEEVDAIRKRIEAVEKDMMEIQARVDEEDEEGVTSKVETGVVNDPSALELQKEKTEITQELLRMEKELVQKEMEDKLSKMANEKEALSHELKFMEELVSKADEERNKVVEEANAEKEVILKEIEYLEKQLLHSKTEVIEALKASSSTRDDIASELATLETEIEAFKGEKIKMEKANETLASMEREKLMLEHKLRDTELEIKETKDLTGSQMAALLRQKASIEKELERAKGEKESLAIQIKELQANMQEAQQEVKEALEIATADRNMLAKENEALEKELEGSKADRDRLAQQLRALKERIFGGDNGQVKSSLGAGFGMEAAVFGKEQLGFSEEECKKGEEVPDSVMWIAEKALVCQLPDGWSEGIGEEGKIVYRHRPVQGEAAVQAEHPLVALFKSATAKYRSEAAAEMGKGDEADMKKVRVDAEAKLSADVEKEVGDLNAKRQGEEEAHRAEQKVKEEEEAKKKAKEEEEKFEKEVEKRVREEVQKKLDEKEKEEQARKEFNRTKIEQELEKKYKTDPIRAEREREMHDYAKYLGMDPVEDEHLLWIAEMALTAPLPIGWSEHLDDDGNIFFYDANTGSSTYEHPLDNAFRQYYAKMKEKEKPRGLAEQQDAKEMDNLRKKIDELQMEIARKDKLILQTKV